MFYDCIMIEENCRFKDTSSDIRAVCARDSHEILLRHSQLRGQISCKFLRDLLLAFPAEEY